MSTLQSILPHLPLLRRYSRALAGSQSGGDAFVAATLQAMLDDPLAIKSDLPARVALYQLFTSVSAEGLLEPAPFFVEDESEAKASEALRALPQKSRQALLLTALEGFSEAEASQILSTSAEDIADRVRQARAAIALETRGEILIIEDETLIALDLIDIVSSLGHKVVATAVTADRAVTAAEASKPNLILADIQLADGSSGIDAVQRILANAAIPVIFITAFPERLLTGERAEPTYLIAKPYAENTVHAIVSQALFFGAAPLRTAKAAA